MANEPNATVEVEDEGVVTIDVTDRPELADDAAAAVEPDKPPKPPAPPRVRTNAADEAAAALTQSLNEEKRRREAAEATADAERRGREEAQRVAGQREREAATYREQAEGHELTLLTTGIDNATREVEAFQADVERAMEAGEFKQAAVAQGKLSKAAAALDRLEASKADYESRQRAPAATDRTDPDQTVQPGSAFERYVAGFSPRSQGWLRAHPEFVPAEVGGDATKNASMMEGHYAALRQKIEPNTDEYFRVIEEHAGLRTPVAARTEPEPEPRPAPRRQPVPAAPVSRDPPNGGGARQTRSVTLTRDQQDAAKLSFPHLPQAQAFAQYATNLLELEAEGKMGRVGH